MKKKIILVIAIFALVFGASFIASHNYSSLKTDSGFDSSYDSGSDYGGSSYDSGGYSDSWGSSSGGRYGGSTGDPTIGLISTLFALLFMGFIFLLAFNSHDINEIFKTGNATKLLNEFDVNKFIACNRVFEIIIKT